MIVLDASAGLAAQLRVGPAREALASEQVHVPHLIDAEVAHAFRRLTLADLLSRPLAHQALQTWSRLGVVRHPMQPLLDRIWELRENVTVHGPSYVALAEALSCSVVTADARLAQLARSGGPRCPITVVPH